MRIQRSLLLAGAAALLSGCGGDEPTRGTGPVTVRFAVPTVPTFTGTGRDTVFAIVTMDGSAPVLAPLDSFTGVARGQHLFTAKLEVEYLEQTFSRFVDPRGSTDIIPITSAPSCRVFIIDVEFCQGKNYVNAGAHRIFCPAGDFGAFCAYKVDVLTLGGTWPNDDAQALTNEYIGQAKLLIAARIGSPTGDRAAMAFLDDGDYLPRVRHHVAPGDSTRFQAIAWTDGRHVPIFPDSTPVLNANDRFNVKFGLQVRTTYLIRQDEKDVIFVRWDVTNISDSLEYRRVHPDMPAGGRTLYNIFLAPIIDPDIGGIRLVGGQRIDDQIDDNGTYFPADSLVVGYDQEFSAPAFGGNYANRPGLVGVRLLTAPAPSEALILDGRIPLRYEAPADEINTYTILAAGRDGARTGCTDRGEAYECVQTGDPEAEHDIRIGFSAGPIASLAPGETVSMQVAILIATPVLGSYTSGTSVPPQNANLTSTTRPIYTIAGSLRTLADRIKAIRVADQRF